MKFTSRHLFALTTLLAIVIAVPYWVSRKYAFDPKSGIVTVDGKSVDVDWQESPLVTPISTMANSTQTLVSDIPLPSVDSVKVEQGLFQYSCKNHFGLPAFHIRCRVSGRCNTDLSMFDLAPYVDGGGSTDGSCRVETHFEPSRNSIVVNVVQTFGRTVKVQESQRAIFEFAFDGSRFHLVESEHVRFD